MNKKYRKPFFIVVAATATLLKGARGSHYDGGSNWDQK